MLCGAAVGHPLVLGRRGRTRPRFISLRIDVCRLSTAPSSVPREGDAAAAAAQVLSVGPAGLCLPGRCRAEGQPCPGLCPLSPASGQVAQPRAQQRVPKASAAASRALAFLIGATRSVNSQQGRSGREVAAMKSSSVPDLKQQDRETGIAQSPRWVRAGVVPCPGNTLPVGRGEIWWQWRGEPRGGWFSKGWEMRLRSHLRTNPTDPPAPKAGGQTPVPVCWRRAPCGFPGCTLTNSSLGALC